MLITHRHHDHADYSLAKRLAGQGKTVIGPAQLKQIWKDFADKLSVPTYGKVQKGGNLGICASRRPGASGTPKQHEVSGIRQGTSQRSILDWRS